MGVSSPVDDMWSYHQDDVDIPVEDLEDTPIDDLEETISICDICNTIVGECTFVIEPEGTVNYYQEALERLWDDHDQFFIHQPSSEEMGIKMEEDLIDDGLGSSGNDDGASDCVDKNNSFVFDFVGIYHIIFSIWAFFPPY